MGTDCPIYKPPVPRRLHNLKQVGAESNRYRWIFKRLRSTAPGKEATRRTSRVLPSTRSPSKSCRPRFHSTAAIVRESKAVMTATSRVACSTRTCYSLQITNCLVKLQIPKCRIAPPRVSL